jgi:steroid delta-isomerase-like uncharacterized protein
MAEENIAAVRRVLEDAFNQGDLEVIDEVCAESYVDHDPVLGDGDREELKQRIAGYREAFPDLSFTIQDIFDAGDKVVIRWTGQGTFQKEFMGLQPTGERGDPVRGISIDRFEDGMIAESWVQWDALTFMRNIGAIADQAAAPAGG